MQDAALEIDEGNRLIGANLHDAFLDENLAASEDDALFVFDPSGHIVGANDDGPGITGNIPCQQRDLGGWIWRGRSDGLARS